MLKAESKRREESNALLIDFIQNHFENVRGKLHETARERFSSLQRSVLGIEETLSMLEGEIGRQEKEVRSALE